MSRYTWQYEDPDGWVETSRFYFQEMWFASTEGGGQTDFCVIRVGDEFFAAPTETLNRKYDIGPFETLEAAKLAAILAWSSGAFDGPFVELEEPEN